MKMTCAVCWQKHKDNLLVNPAQEDAQARIAVLRGILDTMVPIRDTAVALQCPLSKEVQMSLVASVSQIKEEIMHCMQHNPVLSDLRVHLEHLCLLQEALRLPEVVQNYTSALQEIKKHAEERTQMACTSLNSQSFLQVHSFLSTLNCDLDMLAPYFEEIGNRNVLDVLRNKAIGEINCACKDFLAELDQVLLQSDFDSAAEVLERCESLLEHLKEYVLPSNEKMATHGAVDKVLARMHCNTEDARALIMGKCFDAKLASLLTVIRKSSEHRALLQHVKRYSDGRAGMVQPLQASGLGGSLNYRNRAAQELEPEPTPGLSSCKSMRLGANDEGAEETSSRKEDGQMGKSALSTESAKGKRTHSAKFITSEGKKEGGRGTDEGRKAEKDSKGGGRGRKSRRVENQAEEPAAANADSGVLPLPPHILHCKYPEYIYSRKYSRKYMYMYIYSYIYLYIYICMYI